MTHFLRPLLGNIGKRRLQIEVRCSRFQAENRTWNGDPKQTVRQTSMNCCGKRHVSDIWGVASREEGAQSDVNERVSVIKMKKVLWSVMEA